MSQDEKCFACGRKFRRNSWGFIVFHAEALTIDGQRVFVGHECAKKIAETKHAGFRPPFYYQDGRRLGPGGPRLWTEAYAPAEALKAAGITRVVFEEKQP